MRKTKTMIRALIAGIVTLGFSVSTVFAALTDDLRLGARPAAMGGAYAGWADGYHSLYWNPAGLARFQGIDVADLFIPQPFDNNDLTHNYLSFAYGDQKRRFGVGLSMRYLGADLESGSGNGSVIETSDYNEFEWILGAGLRLLNNLYAGINIKQYSIDATSGGTKFSLSGNALDFGLMYEWAKYDAHVGLMVRNFAVNIGSEEVDPTYRLGIGKSFLERKLRFGLDISEESDPADGQQDWRLNIGAEYIFNKQFALRLGSDDGDFTGGIGINWGNAAFDYAYVDNSDLDASHQFSLGYRFGAEYQARVYDLDGSEVQKHSIPKTEKKKESRRWFWQEWSMGKEKKDKSAKPASKTESAKAQKVVSGREKTEVKTAAPAAAVPAPVTKAPEPAPEPTPAVEPSKPSGPVSFWVYDFRGENIPTQMKWVQRKIKEIVAHRMRKENGLKEASRASRADYKVKGSFTKKDGEIVITARLVDNEGNEQVRSKSIPANKVFAGGTDIAEELIKLIRQ